MGCEAPRVGHCDAGMPDKSDTLTAHPAPADTGNAAPFSRGDLGLYRLGGAGLF